MSTKRISQLNGLLAPAVVVATDVLPVVDTSAGATKKITVDELSKAITNLTAPTVSGNLAITGNNTVTGTSTLSSTSQSFAVSASNSNINFSNLPSTQGQAILNGSGSLWVSGSGIGGGAQSGYLMVFNGGDYTNA